MRPHRSSTERFLTQWHFSVTIVKKQLDLTAKQTSLLRVGKLGVEKKD